MVVSPGLAVLIFKDRVVDANHESAKKTLLSLQTLQKLAKEGKVVPGATYESTVLDEKLQPKKVVVKVPPLDQMPIKARLQTSRQVAVDPATGEVKILESLNNPSPRWLRLHPLITENIVMVLDSKRKDVRIFRED